jgi:hypothetical protein
VVHLHGRPSRKGVFANVRLRGPLDHVAWYSLLAMNALLMLVLLKSEQSKRLLDNLIIYSK